MLGRLLCGVVALMVGVGVVARPAAAEPRIALVVGNGAYAEAPLPTSLADGGLVADALERSGFDLVEGADLDQADLRRAFRNFLARVEAAGADATAFVYVSGYGFQFRGENYLVPVDARLERDNDIPLYAVPLSDLIGPLASAPARTKVVAIDVSHPFAIPGATLARGLGDVDVRPGMLVASSTWPGTLANDAPGPYGPYATAIAQTIGEPGLDLDAVFARVRRLTHHATEGRQTPWHVSALIEPTVVAPTEAKALVMARPRIIRRQPRREPVTVGVAPGGTAMAEAPERAIRPVDPEIVAVLLKRGEELVAVGDIAGARVLLKRAAESRHPRAALALGATYDPIVLEKLGARSVPADIAMARTWYQTAKELGSAEAQARLEQLANRAD